MIYTQTGTQGIMHDKLILVERETHDGNRKVTSKSVILGSCRGRGAEA
jgi:hypothetical protein